MFVKHWFLRWLLLEVGFEFGGGGGQLFGFEAGFGDGGHEAGVARSARQQVRVQVVGHAGT